MKSFVLIFVLAAVLFLCTPRISGQGNIPSTEGKKPRSSGVPLIGGGNGDVKIYRINEDSPLRAPFSDTEIYPTYVRTYQDDRISRDRPSLQNADTIRAVYARAGGNDPGQLSGGGNDKVNIMQTDELRKIDEFPLAVSFISSERKPTNMHAHQNDRLNRDRPRLQNDSTVRVVSTGGEEKNPGKLFGGGNGNVNIMDTESGQRAVSGSTRRTLILPPSHTSRAINKPSGVFGDERYGGGSAYISPESGQRAVSGSRTRTLILPPFHSSRAINKPSGVIGDERYRGGSTYIYPASIPSPGYRDAGRNSGRKPNEYNGYSGTSGKIDLNNDKRNNVGGILNGGRTSLHVVDVGDTEIMKESSLRAPFSNSENNPTNLHTYQNGRINRDRPSLQNANNMRAVFARNGGRKLGQLYGGGKGKVNLMDTDEIRMSNESPLIAPSNSGINPTNLDTYQNDRINKDRRSSENAYDNRPVFARGGGRDPGQSSGGGNRKVNVMDTDFLRMSNESPLTVSFSNNARKPTNVHVYPNDRLNRDRPGLQSDAITSVVSTSGEVGNRGELFGGGNGNVNIMDTESLLRAPSNSGINPTNLDTYQNDRINRYRPSSQNAYDNRSIFARGGGRDPGQLSGGGNGKVNVMDTDLLRMSNVYPVRGEFINNEKRLAASNPYENDSQNRRYGGVRNHFVKTIVFPAAPGSRDAGRNNGRNPNEYNGHRGESVIIALNNDKRNNVGGILNGGRTSLHVIDVGGT